MPTFADPDGCLPADRAHDCLQAEAAKRLGVWQSSQAQTRLKQALTALPKILRLNLPVVINQINGARQQINQLNSAGACKTGLRELARAHRTGGVAMIGTANLAAISDAVKLADCVYRLRSEHPSQGSAALRGKPQ